MANFAQETIDTGSLELEGGQFRDDVIAFTGAATLLRGTLLARDSVSLKLVPFVKGGSTNENGIPKAVLTYEVSAAGAGDVPVRPLVKGVVNRNRLVIDADGDDSNIDAAVVDQLADYQITAIDVEQLGVI